MAIQRPLSEPTNGTFGANKLAPCILWSGVLERSTGLEWSDFGVAKAEWIAVMMCYVTCEHNNIYEMTLSTKDAMLKTCYNSENATLCIRNIFRYA